MVFCSPYWFKKNVKMSSSECKFRDRKPRCQKGISPWSIHWCLLNTIHILPLFCSILLASWGIVFPKLSGTSWQVLISQLLLRPLFCLSRTATASWVQSLGKEWKDFSGVKVVWLWCLDHGQYVQCSSIIKQGFTKPDWWFEAIWKTMSQLLYHPIHHNMENRWK